LPAQCSCHTNREWHFTVSVSCACSLEWGLPPAWPSVCGHRKREVAPAVESGLIGGFLLSVVGS